MRWLIWCALLVSGFCVLPFICFPHDFVFGWVIGWDCSMFLCPSAPPWFRHQSLLHPVVGALSCSEELDLGSCFNLSVFGILNFKTRQIPSFSLSLEFCVLSQHRHVSYVPSAVFSAKHSRARFQAQGCGLDCHDRFIRLPHPCIEHWISCVHQLQQPKPVPQGLGVLGCHQVLGPHM